MHGGLINLFKKKDLRWNTYSVFKKDPGSNLYNRHITTFYIPSHPYPGIVSILKRVYGLKDDDKIKITHNARFWDSGKLRKGAGGGKVFRNFRTPFKPYFFGTVNELNEKLRSNYKKYCWKKKDEVVAG